MTRHLQASQLQVVDETFRRQQWKSESGVSLVERWRKGEYYILFLYCSLCPLVNSVTFKDLNALMCHLYPSMLITSRQWLRVLGAVHLLVTWSQKVSEFRNQTNPFSPCSMLSPIKRGGLYFSLCADDCSFRFTVVPPQLSSIVSVRVALSWTEDNQRLRQQIKASVSLEKGPNKDRHVDWDVPAAIMSADSPPKAPMHLTSLSFNLCKECS